MLKKIFAVLFCAGFLVACSGFHYVPLEFRSEGQLLIARGTIDGSTPKAFRKALADNPQATTLVLSQIQGSVDDDANLVFSREVRAAGLATLVPADGLVASGGTDLFLAGVQRTLENGACVGVHSWGTENESGTDVPRNEPVHDLYLTYYDTMGIDRAFYWFTLEAATVDDMHWMTADEAHVYGMITTPVTQLSGSSICDLR